MTDPNVLAAQRAAAKKAERRSTALDIAGAALVVAGIALWSIPAALIVAGLASLLAAHPILVKRWTR